MRDEYATVIFVGKSLAATGGQNPIEPGALGKAMVFGPHMENFQAVAQAFTAAQAAVQVADAQALERELAALLDHPSRREDLGRRALQVVAANRGSIDRTVDMIVQALRHEDIYIAG